MNMCHASPASLQLVKDALREFGGLSGLKPNYQKCNIFISGVSDEVKQQLSMTMEMEVRELPMRDILVFL